MSYFTSIKDDLTYMTLSVIRVIQNIQNSGNNIDYVSPLDVYEYYKDTYSFMTIDYIEKIFIYLESSCVVEIKYLNNEHFKIRANLMPNNDLRAKT